MRAVSRTTLSLGDLLEIPIGIVPATGSEEPKIDTAAPDGAKRQQLYVHPTEKRHLFELPAGKTLADVEADGDLTAVDLTPVDVPEPITDTVKGVRIGGELVEVPESELEAAKAVTKLDSVRLLEAIDYRRVRTDRLKGAHYVQPDPGFAKPLAVLMAAMRRDGRALAIEYSVRDRQRLGVIRVRSERGTDGKDHDVLLLNDVTYANDWRRPDDGVIAPSLVDVDERSVEAAVSILQDLGGDGSKLDAARDQLIPELTRITEHAIDGDYSDPGRVLALAARYRAEDFGERADRLVAWAEQRWPELEEKREAIEEVLDGAAEGEDVGAQLAAIVG